MKLENCEVLSSRGSRSLVLSSLQVSGGTIWAFYLTTRYSSSLFFSILFFSFLSLYFYFYIIFFYFYFCYSSPLTILLSTSKLITLFSHERHNKKDSCSIAQSIEHMRDEQKYPPLPLVSCFLYLFIFIFIICFVYRYVWEEFMIKEKIFMLNAKGERGERRRPCSEDNAMHDAEDLSRDWIKGIIVPPLRSSLPLISIPFIPSFLLQSFLFTLFLRGTYVAT